MSVKNINQMDYKSNNYHVKQQRYDESPLWKKILFVSLTILSVPMLAQANTSSQCLAQRDISMLKPALTDIGKENLMFSPVLDNNYERKKKIFSVSDNISPRVTVIPDEYIDNFV